MGIQSAWDNQVCCWKHGSFELSVTISVVPITKKINSVLHCDRILTSDSLGYSWDYYWENNRAAQIRAPPAGHTLNLQKYLKLFKDWSQDVSSSKLSDFLQFQDLQ